MKQFMGRYAKVKPGLHQGSPTRTAEQLLHGEAGIGIATESLSLIDADVIKAYVELGLAIGILAEIAFIPEREPNLRSMNTRHLFKPGTTRIAIRKNECLRTYTYNLIEPFAPHLTCEVVTRAMDLFQFSCCKTENHLTCLRIRFVVKQCTQNPLSIVFDSHANTRREYQSITAAR